MKSNNNEMNDICNLILENFPIKQSNYHNKKKTKCNPSLCPETNILVKETVISLATTQLEMEKLKIIMDEKTAKADQVLGQCLPEHKEKKEKLYGRKAKQKEYKEKMKHELYGQKELKRRISEFVALREDYYEKDRKRAMEYSTFVHGIRKFYWPNDKWIKNLDGIEISPDNFKHLSYPTINEETGAMEWVYRLDRINLSYPAILVFAQKNYRQAA